MILTAAARTELWDAADIETPVQLLDPEGRRGEHPVYGPIAEALTEDDLRAMYRAMVRARTVDNAAVALQRQGELGLWAPCRGQEAAQVGSAYAARERDMVFPSYREHAVAAVRGLPLRDLFPVMRGTRHGGWDPAAYNFHAYTFVLAAQLPHAAGYAMAIQRDGDVGTGDAGRDRAALAYIGDGAMTEGDANEALIFAASAGAPLVTVCQNNHWAISVPVTTQSRMPLAQRAAGMGVPAVRVDGNDPLASYAATVRALEHARAGRGPAFVEAVTYRMGAHTTSDDPTRYRTREEEAAWEARDPIARLRAHLEAAGLADAAFLTEVDDAVAAEVDEIRAFVRAQRASPAVTMFDDVYALPHAQVTADREAWLAYEAGFVDEASAADPAEET